MNISKKKAINELKIVDDIHEVDRHDTLKKINENAILSTSYVVLLIASSVICTLGLLQDSPAIVIGGMIISPLMWPLMKISAGISLARKKYISNALFLLLVSIAISLASAFLITIISPLKVLNAEILSRTQPTLIDIIIALAVGIVAALAVALKKVSSNLAGVAIAASLMPPLCVGGIGLALWHPQVAIGGLLLFFANIVSIIFISIFAFRVVGVETRVPNKLQKEGTVFVSIMLLVTALPLFFFLQSYSFESAIYQKTQKILSHSLSNMSQSIYLENVKTTLNKSNKDGKEFVQIEADILVPEDTTIDFDQKKLIIDQLEKELNKNVVLNLRIQKSIALQTETDMKMRNIKNNITKILQKEISAVDKSLTIDSITIIQNEHTIGWVVDVVLRSDPSIKFTEDKRKSIEEAIAYSVDGLISFNLEIISRIKLQGESDMVASDIKTQIYDYFNERFEDIDVSNLSIMYDENLDQYTVSITVTIPKKTRFTSRNIESLKALLEVKHTANFSMVVNQIEKTIYEFE